MMSRIAVLGLLVLAPIAGAEETMVRWEQVPAAARDAAQAAVKDVRFEKVGMEEENGQKVYEFAGRNMEGQQIEIDVTANGELLEIETVILRSDVPNTVRQALKRQFADFQPEFVERSVRPYQGVYYEFEGRTAEGHAADIEVSACGTKFVCEMKDGEDIGSTAGHSEEQSLDLNSVPELARATAQQAASDIRLTSAAVENEDGRTVYELKGQCPQGRKCEIDVTAEGELCEIEREINKDQVPQQVQKVLSKIAKDFRPDFIEKSERPQHGQANSQGQQKGQMVVWYEFEGADGQGRRLDIEINEEGNEFVLETEDDIDADHQDGQQGKRQARN